MCSIANTLARFVFLFAIIINYVYNNVFVLDAEVLLLSQSATRILSSKKIPMTYLLKFLISKGMIPLPEMTKSDLCVAFKTLVESQPDYVKPLVQIQPFQCTHMPVVNTMELSQNNNMMMQHYQPPIQQVRLIKQITIL